MCKRETKAIGLSFVGFAGNLNAYRPGKKYRVGKNSPESLENPRIAMKPR